MHQSFDSQRFRSGLSNDSYAYTGGYNVNRAYAVNGLNQYVSAGPAMFSYDANGNLTGDGTTAYVYDAENRLVSATPASGGAPTASLRYDPLGRLYETIGSTSGITRFLNDGDELVAEFDGAGTLLRRYAHGTSVDDPVVAYEGSGTATPRWLHTNHQGSIVAVSDNTGSVTTKNSYDEWGIPASTNASITAGGRFAYTGQAWIPELGMYYYKARIYSPTLGRFMQTDPVGYKDQVNLYAYVGNDPVNKTDPKGLDAVDCNGFRPQGDVIYVCGSRRKAKCKESCAVAELHRQEIFQRQRKIIDDAEYNKRINPPTGQPDKGRPNYCFYSSFQLGKMLSDLGGLLSGAGYGASAAGQPEGLALIAAGGKLSTAADSLKAYAGDMRALRRLFVDAATAGASAYVPRLVQDKMADALVADITSTAGKMALDIAAGVDPCE